MYFTLLIVVILTAIALVAVALGIANAISPRSFNPQKGEAYECGIPTRGKSWMQFKVGYYLFAILFIERRFKDFDEEMDYDNSLAFDAVVEANDEDEAKKIFFQDWFDLYSRGNKPEEYDIYIDEIPLEEMIEKEQRMLRHRLICRYVSEKLGDLSVREFNRMMRDDDADEKNQMFYEGLRDLLKQLRLSAYLERRLETDKLSHAEFCEIRNALCSAKPGEEFEKINLAAAAKYGKAVND